MDTDRSSYPIYGNEAIPGTQLRAGVGVLILNSEGKILLELRSDCGFWGLIGGRLEPGESLQEAAHRETYEETGLSISITGLLGVYSEPQDRIVTYPDNVVQLIDIIFTASISGGSLRCSEESHSLEFFSRYDLPARNEVVPPARQPIQDFLAGLNNIVR
ncbi:MAG: NUDIX domain-containing protein [Cyanobacteria bacterium P01_D01_bin.56]